MKIFLYPLSLIYYLLLLLNKKLTKVKKLSKPVISIGNITWGGTGKTSLVIKLAQFLISQGLRPAILTRGYNRKKETSECQVVSDGKLVLLSPELAGDEPYMIAENVPGAVVIVGSNRIDSASLAIEKFSPDVFILDDGFQHWKLERDLDIVCIDSTNPFGNGFLIPSGILREPISSLKRAGMVVLTNTDSVDYGKLAETQEKIKEIIGDHFLKAKYQGANLISISNGEEININKFIENDIVALSALGNNDAFKKTLLKHDLNVIKHFKFKDHHWFSLVELENILKKIPEACDIVVTLKDSVRLKNIINNMDPNHAKRFFAFTVNIIFDTGEKNWEQQIKKTLQFS